MNGFCDILMFGALCPVLFNLLFFTEFCAPSTANHKINIQIKKRSDKPRLCFKTRRKLVATLRMHIEFVFQISHYIQKLFYKPNFKRDELMDTTTKNMR